MIHIFDRNRVFTKKRTDGHGIDTVSANDSVNPSYDGSELGRLRIEIFFHHQCHLKGDGMLKLSQIQAGQLADLLQTVDQGISVHKQLAGGLGNIEVVLKEALNGHQRLAVKRLEASLLENFLQEHLAKRGRQLIDQTADAEVLIADDVLFGLKHLADLIPSTLDIHMEKYTR